MNPAESFHIFLLGRPGCGKSEIYRRLSAELIERGLVSSCARMDDFPKLWAIFQEDEKTGGWKRCRKTPDGGYKVTDSAVWDDILKELSKDILRGAKPGQVLFIEFSRPNYRESLQNFPPQILKRSAMIYIACSFDACWERNVARHKAALARGTDNHLVSREEMEKTYLHDDGKSLREDSMGMPLIWMENEKEGLAHLPREIEKAMEQIREILQPVGKKSG